MVWFNKKEELEQRIEELEQRIKELEAEIETIKSGSNSQNAQEEAIAEDSAEAPALQTREVAIPPTSETVSGSDTQWQESLQKDVALIKSQIENATYKDQIIKDLHNELQKCNRNMYAEITKPLLKSIVKIHERLTKTYLHFNKLEIQEQQEAYSLLLKELNSNQLAVQDLLEDEYGLEYFEPQTGSAYYPKEQNALRTLPTQKAEQAGTVAECLYGGFRNYNSKQMFKPAIVTVYKLDK